MFGLDLNRALHWLKRRVIANSWLRAKLREGPLRLLQLDQLRRVCRYLPVSRAEDERGQRPVVVVLALRPWPISRAWEAVLSRTLMQLGCEVRWIVCDRHLTRCDAMMDSTPDRRLCDHCVSYNRSAASIAGVRAHPLSSFAQLNPVGVRGGSNAAELSPEVCEELIRASFQRCLGRGEVDPAELSASEAQILAELRRSARETSCAAGPALDALRPDVVLSLNGKFFSEALFARAAQRRGIAVWSYERGTRRDTIALSTRAAAIPFDTEEIIGQLERDPLDAAQRQTIVDYLEDRFFLGNGQVRFQDRRGQGIPGGRRGAEHVFALFSNLVWDSAVAGEDTIFASMFDWIATAIDHVATRPEQLLVIRVHPGEQKIYWHRTRDRVADALRARYPAGLPHNVVLVDASDPADSYQIVDEADTVLVYTSSIGMEAAARGKRVIVAANTHFAAAPFVLRPQSAAAYLAALAAPPPHGAETVDAAELARRYMYRLYFELFVPIPEVTEDPTGFRVTPRRRYHPSEKLRRTLQRMLAERR
jgi:fructose-specific component phosphotransferase system IIB-like protein